MLKRILAGAAAAATIGAGVLAAAPAQASAPKADACSLSVGASHPKDYTHENVYVRTSGGYTHVKLTFHYKTTTPSVTVETSTRGYDTYSRYISGATPGYRVNVSGKVTAAPKGYKTGATCSTSFTPAK
ncbi:MAG TPA: hypothetical protein VHF26_01210 [Trebonia sp.]|nr:hypothetical protein [Trebonia sp.]